MVIVTICGESYYLNKKLKETWDKIKDGQLKKLDEDRVYVTDGRERIGKSVFTLQQAAYIDPSIISDALEKKDMSRIAFTPQETLDAIRKYQSTSTKTKVIIFDEAFRGLSSKSAISKVNKKIVQSMMEMGQKNLVLFLVSPSFFMLEYYPAVLRANTLFHILKDKKIGRRYVRMFNYKKKAMLYQAGIKKGWGYKIHTRYKDYFSNKYPGGKAFEKMYRAKKLKSITNMDEDSIKEEQEQERTLTPRNFIIYDMYYIKKLSQRAISKELEKRNIKLTQQAITLICKRVRENLEKRQLTSDKIYYTYDVKRRNLINSRKRNGNNTKL